jgi:cold shock CspA family protein
MKEGTVKKWLEGNNYGFIKTAEGDVFLHISGCVDGYVPAEWDQVVFVIGKNDRTGRPQAQEVRLA